MGKFSLGLQILVAVILGIFCGFFFGPLTSVLNPIGSAYTMLLQMAVLPYITFSLIHGLGSMQPMVGKKIFKVGWPYFLSLWIFVFLLIFLLASLIPNVLPSLIVSEASSQIEAQFTKNFLSNLIPENPFYDVINNIVPAVALFGIITGVALMHVEKKEPLIGALERVNQTIEKILYWLGQISPIGVFVYISIAFGTIYFHDLFKMQLYVFACILSVLFVVLWLLPTLISALTPISYQEAIKTLRYVCLVPFFTGLSTTALPFINNYLKRLSQKHETHEEFRETSQTILPIAYSFGHIGNAMILFFILFLSYYYHHPFTLIEKGLLALLTIPLSFGSSTGNVNSILFLIQKLGFPSGSTELFLEIKSFTQNFQVLMSIATVFTLLLLTIYAYYGLIQVRWKQLGLRLGCPLAAFIALILGARSITHPDDLYQNLYMNLSLSEVISQPVQASVLPEAPQESHQTTPNAEVPDILPQILTSKILKVGYFPDSVPYCYMNNQKQLVGFDVSYAYELAHDLECTLEFIPIGSGRLAQQLEGGVFDLGMSSIIMNEERLTKMAFSFPYLDDNNVLVIPRAQKNSFLNLEAIQSSPGLKIGADEGQYEMAKIFFPQAEIVLIRTSDKLLSGELDARFWTQSTAVIWCLSHPQYVTIDYGSKLGNSYYAYPFRQHATNFGFFLNNWLLLKEHSGFKQQMLNYWLHGISPKARAPRWSILHNVLHWVD